MTAQRVLEEAEARQLPSVIAEWSERTDVLRWVARSLQLDLPLLIEHPALVLPCLYRRCAAFGAAHYASRDAPADAPALAALIDDWIASARPRRWLRALRPPQHPLEAGVIEEYRSSIEGDIRFSADGSLVGIVGKAAAVGWERAGGRKIGDAAARLAVPRAPRWELERASGRILLRSGARRWELPVRPEESMFSPVELSDDLVIVNCSYEDDPYDYHSTYAHYLVDVAAGRIVWRMPESCFDAMLVGDRLLARSDGIVVRSVATGERLACHAIPYTRSIAFGAFGAFGALLVATHDHGVLRIWDLASTPAKVPTAHAGGGSLSPDATRVLAGDMLWDAVTGELVAGIALSGRGNWLEGGPPANAWSLVNRRVVEVLPFDTHLWDSADGRQLATLRVRAGAGDAVLADPEARYLAIHRRRPAQLAIHSLDDGALLFETSAAIAESDFRNHRFGWTEAGDELWWETKDGKVYVLAVASWHARELARGAAAPEASPRRIDIADGLLVAGDDLFAPMDSTTAEVSRDRRIFVGGDHYRVEP